MATNNVLSTVACILITLVISNNVIKCNYLRDKNYCANHTEKCDLTVVLPCCNINEQCKRIGWGAFRYELRCTKEAYLGDSCKSTLDCHKVSHAECTEGKKCRCSSNFVEVNNSKCLSRLNSFCLNDEDCVTNNSICDGFRCKCKFDYISTHNNKSCERKKLYKFCRRDDDCEDINHSKCSENNECICRRNNVAINSTVCVPMMNGFCWKNEPCAADNSVCINSVCRCKPNFKYIADKICLETYLGMSCHNNTDCKEILNAECSIDKVCDCVENAMRINETYCAPLLSGYCKNDKQCLPDNSICVDKICQCKPNFISIAQFKCSLVTLGNYCNNNLDCKDRSHRKCSKNSKCVCEPNHIAVNEFLCLPVIDGFCFDNNDCLPNNSYCFAHRCRCKDNFIPLSDNLCILKTDGKSCKLNNDCLNMKYAECYKNEKCICKHNTIVKYNSTCLPIIGGYCENNEECTISNSECINHKCECKYDFFSPSSYTCDAYKRSDTIQN